MVLEPAMKARFGAVIPSVKTRTYCVGCVVRTTLAGALARKAAVGGVLLI